MALTGKRKSKITADVKSGKLNKTQIAQKWRISRNTLDKIIKEFKATPGENAQKVNNKIEQKATERIIERGAKKLTDYTAKHLAELNTIRTISRYNIQTLAKEIKDTKNKVSREKADRLFAIQKICKITTETLGLIYKDERLAMGLDKPQGRDDEGIEDRIKRRMDKFK